MFQFHLVSCTESEGCASAWALMNFQNVVGYKTEIMLINEETNQEEESLCLTIF